MEDKTNNPFEALADFYKEGVAKIDEEGHADTYKKGTEMFFKHVGEIFRESQKTQVHFEDIEYLDGYFIFASGTNSVVQFHIKECPGWKFAIWWHKPDEETGKFIRGEFFTQYEETIDKFKPSRSELIEEINADTSDEEPSCSCWNAALLIRFIRDDPYLAFCRDYCGWNYNHEFHSREEARAEYDEWRLQEEDEKKYTEIIDEKVLSFVREKILPLFNDAVIADDGISWDPRYDIYAPFEKNKDIVDQPGCYGWFSEDGSDDEIRAEYRALCEECKKLGEEHHVWYHTTIGEAIVFLDDEKWMKLSARLVNEND
jgi:hypothetical protein